MNWQSFLYKSNCPTSYTNYYYHYLPEDHEDLLPFPLPEGTDDLSLPEYYQPFDTVIHVTTEAAADRILTYGFKPKCVDDSSVVNSKMELLEFNDEARNRPRKVQPRYHHPVHKLDVIWYGPMTLSYLKNNDTSSTHFERYGNIGFFMPKMEGYEGIHRRSSWGDPQLKLYFIEVIEYAKQRYYTFTHL